MTLKFPNKNPNIVCLPVTPDNVPAYIEYMAFLARLPENNKKTYGTRNGPREDRSAFPGRTAGVPGCYNRHFSPSNGI